MKKEVVHVWSIDASDRNDISVFFDSVLTASDTHFIYYAAEEHSLGGEECETTSVENRVALRKAIKDRVENHNVKIDIVFGRLLQFDHDEVWNDLEPYITMHTWPTFFAYDQLSDYSERLNRGDNITNNPEPTKLFALKQNKAHWHRCVLMDEIAGINPSLIRNNLVTWVEGSTYMGAEPYSFQHWQEEILQFEDIGPDFNFNMSDPPGYYDCLFDVVNETHASRLFYTEKTFKSIILKRPFVIYGGKHINAMLAETFGFELFPELFDYEFEKYDNITNRAKHLVQQLDQYTKNPADWKELHCLVKDKTERNYRRMINLVRDQENIPDIVYEFEPYNNNITRLSDLAATEKFSPLVQKTKEEIMKEQLEILRSKDPFVYK